MFEILDPRILWPKAERGDFMTVLLFSTKISYVSSFFESIFILIDNYLKPYLFRYRVLVGLGVHVIMLPFTKFR